MLDLAIVQAATSWEDKDKNLNKVAECVAAAKGADIVVFPEMFTTGFTMNVAQMAEPMSGKSVERLREIAAQNDRAIMGSIIIEECGQFFNRMMLVQPDGTIQKYDKHHLFRMGAENDTYTRGEERTVFNYKGFRILATVCYDLRFPVWLRNRGDYDLMVNVACWPEARAYAWSTLIRARAIENLSYVAGVNMVGNDPALVYSGNSAIIDFLGQPICEATSNTEQILRAKLDLSKLKEFRTKFPAWMDADNFSLE